MPTMVLFVQDYSDPNYIIDSVVSWEVIGIQTANAGVIASSSSPGTWTVSIAPSPGASVDTPTDFFATVSTASDFGIVDHFRVDVVIRFAFTLSSFKKNVTFSGFGTRFKPRALTTVVDDESVEFTTETESTLEMPADVPFTKGYNGVDGRFMSHWEYEFGDGDTLTTTDNPITHDYPDVATYTGRYRVFDQYGLHHDGPGSIGPTFESGWVPFNVTTLEILNVISGLSDHNGVSYVAAKVGDDVKVYKYTDGKPTETVMYTLSGHSAPSIYQHKNDATIYLAAKRTSDNVYRLLKSENLASTFTFMANSPFDFATYKTPSCCDLSDGRHAQCAIRKTDDPVENVYFSYSTDGITWVEPIFAFALTDIKGVSIYEENRSGSSVIVIAATRANIELGAFLLASSHGGLADSWVNYEDLD